MSETTLLATASNINYDDVTFTASGNNNNNPSSHGQQQQQRPPEDMSGVMLTVDQTSDVFANPTFPSSRLSIPNTYIPFLASLPGTSTVVAGTTSENENENGVWTVDLTSARLLRKYPCPRNGSDPTITALKAGVDGRTFLTTSRDKAFRVWDVRASPSDSAYMQITASQPLLSFDIDGSFLATGTEFSTSSGASIIFWDTRNPKSPLYQHESTHSDDITVLRFKPTSSPSSNENPVLLSASTDGLICLSNAREQDEDEAGLHVGNWGKSVSKCDWMQNGSGVWSASDMETFAVWDGELNPTYDFGDLRTPSIRDTWESNYIIDASWYPASSGLTSSSSDFLGIWMGNNNGDFALLNPTSPRSMQVERVFRSSPTLGHSGIVRSVLYHKESRCIVTGGEDSLIHIWPSSSPGSSTPIPTSTPSTSTFINKRLVSLDDEGDTMMGTPTPPTSPRRMDDGILPSTSTKGRKRKTDDSAPSGDKKRGKQGF